MKKATFLIEYGRVILTFADGKQAILPISFPQPPVSGGECEYLRKKKILYVNIPGIKLKEVPEQEVEFRDSPKVAVRKQEEAEKKIQEEAIVEAQKAAIEGGKSNLQPSLENGRVIFFAEKIASVDRELIKTYTDAAKGAWALVRRHTLGPAIIFFDYQKTKTNDLAPAYKLLYDHLVSWFMDPKCMLAIRPMEKAQFLSFLTNELDSNLYRAYTLETLSCLQWVARLAEAESKNY